MNENNINGKIAFLRDTFLKAEKDYLEELIKEPKYKNFIEDLNKYNSKELSLKAVKRISAIESGKVKEEDLEKVETEITLLLASIQDCVREKVKEKITGCSEIRCELMRDFPFSLISCYCFFLCVTNYFS